MRENSASLSTHFRTTNFLEGRALCAIRRQHIPSCHGGQDDISALSTPQQPLGWFGSVESSNQNVGYVNFYAVGARTLPQKTVPFLV